MIKEWQMYAQFRPFSPLTAVFGLRHEHHSEFGSLNLPYYGLSINPWPDRALKFSHGRHFLAPTPNDLFWPEDAWGMKDNPDLNSFFDQTTFATTIYIWLPLMRT